MIVTEKTPVKRGAGQQMLANPVQQWPILMEHHQTPINTAPQRRLPGHPHCHG